MGEADDNDVLQVIKQEVKRRREAIEMYQKAGRTDLLEQEKAELSVLESYLPPLMSEEEIRQVVRSHIEKLQPKSMKERGKIMGSLMQELKGKADGNTVAVFWTKNWKNFLVEGKKPWNWSGAKQH